MKKIGMIMILTLLLSGCSPAGPTVTEQEQEQEQAAVTEQETSPTVSEQELCDQNSDLTNIVSADASSSDTSLLGRIVHLSAVGAVLSEEGSTSSRLVGDLTQALRVLNAIMLDSFHSEYYPAAVESALLEASRSSSEVSEWCNAEINASGFQALTSQLSEIYVDGLWGEQANEDWSAAYLYSLDNEVDFGLDGSAVYVEATSDFVYVQIVCNVTTGISAFAVGRASPDFTPIDFGPTGKVSFKYSLDGGDLVDDEGYFADGSFFPFADGFADNTRSKAVKTAMDLIEGHSELRIVIDSPGSRIDSRFFIHGSSVISDGFESLGCPGF